MGDKTMVVVVAVMMVVRIAERRWLCGGTKKAPYLFKDSVVASPRAASGRLGKTKHKRASR